ncbi:MAG TPA: KUP/HAK/KT family potassium transporter, partial [Pyrinomonadaceae bacterium]|nr:KUP/HAK/KT family potassium transporter [Pyrinomonadaceae bacterium]
QAVQLGLIPRLKITHTSDKEYGQIYLPAVNWALMAGCIVVVLGFHTSSNLAAAYGIAVTSTMVITTALLFVVARERWGWSFKKAALMCSFFLIIDLSFFGANVIKILDGGWFPLTLAAVIFTMMLTWKKGRSILTMRIQNTTEILEDFLEKVEKQKLTRVSGTAVFMNGNATRTPPALMHNLEHNKVLHERILFVTVKTRPIPYVESEERYKYEKLTNGFSRVKVYYGYMEDPDIPKILSEIEQPGFVFNLGETTFFLGRETIIATEKHSGMSRWREKLFGLMSKNARSATAFFRIPPNRVVELGEQVEI